MLTFPGGRLDGVQSRQAVLARRVPKGRTPRADERRSLSSLRARRAADSSRARRPAARDEAVSERHRGQARFISTGAPDKVPAGVRIERVTTATETRPHLVGGSLTTLLYTAQLGSISQDPWFSRVRLRGRHRPRRHRSRSAGRICPTRVVLDVAQWVRDALGDAEGDRFRENLRRRRRCMSTSRCRRAPRTRRACSSRRSSRRWWPSGIRKQATIERALKARGRRIYVDYMQNGARQDAGERLQRARQRVRGRLDANHVGRSG